uniref:Uncharacterized protein n=1 Tax=Kalmanozyma brasiliensis (strain GHG001) TaxID=1365824 RepID=V5EAR1_KALBG
MSAVAPRPASIANSFYESDGRSSIDYGPFTDPNSKTSELARAVGREREGLVPAFRPPSNWTQRSSHHDVVWSGAHQHAQDPNDDQFSDAESWDGETQPSSAAPTNVDHDSLSSVYGHPDQRL